MSEATYEQAVNSRGEHSEFTDDKGYVWVTAPKGHPRTSKRYRYKGVVSGTGYVKRAVLVAERKIGRLMVPNEHVHHVNGNKGDDRPENLEVLDASDHCRITTTETVCGRKRVGAPGKGDPCARCSKPIGTPKRGLCTACYLRAKRHREAHGEWPEYATRFSRSGKEGHE